MLTAAVFKVCKFCVSFHLSSMYILELFKFFLTTFCIKKIWDVYDIILELNYNKNPIIRNKGSAIFIHLTKNYIPTAGCIGLAEKDFLILI